MTNCLKVGALPFPLSQSGLQLEGMRMIYRHMLSVNDKCLKNMHKLIEEAKEAVQLLKGRERRTNHYQALQLRSHSK
jgi:hypothetical protein